MYSPVFRLFLLYFAAVRTHIEIYLNEAACYRSTRPTRWHVYISEPVIHPGCSVESVLTRSPFIRTRSDRQFASQLCYRR